VFCLNVLVLFFVYFYLTWRKGQGSSEVLSSLCVCLHLYAFLMLIFSSCKAARSMKVKHLFGIFHWMSSTKFMVFDLIVNPRWPPPQKQESPRCQKRILLVFCMWSIFHQIAQINYCLQFHQICWISDFLNYEWVNRDQLPKFVFWLIFIFIKKKNYLKNSFS
jgi:hypothetical protein